MYFIVHPASLDASHIVFRSSQKMRTMRLFVHVESFSGAVAGISISRTMPLQWFVRYRVRFSPRASNSVDVFPAFRRFCEQALITGQGFFVRYMSLQSFLRSSPLPLSVVHRMRVPSFVSIRQQVMPAVSPIRNVSVAGCTRNQPRFFVSDPEESLFALYPSWICLFPLV